MVCFKNVFLISHGIKISRHDYKYEEKVPIFLTVSGVNVTQIRPPAPLLYRMKIVSNSILVAHCMFSLEKVL